MSETLVATLCRRGRFWVAEPFSPGRAPAGVSSAGGRSPRRLTLASNRVQPARKQGASDRGKTTSATAREGELVLVGLDGAPHGGHGGRRGHGGRGAAGRARILRVLGRSDVARDVIEALMLDRGLLREFAPGVEREARQLAADGPNGGGRRDLRELATFTIDPVTARDFDDAVSAEPAGGGEVRVWVHIADVAAYVGEGSPLDREARRRATSVYVPGAVEPMLPQALSNDACSLVPGRDRPAVTVEMTIRDGRVTGSSFYRSLIRSDERLDYDRVDRIFAGGERAAEPWGSALQSARSAAAALGESNAERGGSLLLDAPEPEFAFDAQGHVSEIGGRVQTESHRLIEHLMIAANEAVARMLQERGVPTLYRVHENPQAERALRLIEQLVTLGVQTPPAPVAEAMTPQQAAELIAGLSRGIEAHLRRAEERHRRGEKAIPRTGGRLALTSLLLRSLQQARYSPKNIGHAGLGSSCYCHFTSPIRRYPDLVCHRALLSALGGTEHAPAAGGLVELGEWTSAMEREAMTIERDSDDVARCFALRSLLHEEGFDRVFDGEVTGLISAGAFVAFGDPWPGGAVHEMQTPPPYEGMLPVRRMRGPGGEREWWQLNEAGTVLEGERSGTVLRLGGACTVQVARVDALRGRVDLLPAGDDPRPRRGGRRSPRLRS